VNLFFQEKFSTLFIRLIMSYKLLKKTKIMKKLINTLFLSGLFILLIFSCKNKTVEPDLSTLYEAKTDEFIKAEIDGKPFDYRTVNKVDYQEYLKFGQTSGMLECAGCKNSMFIFFVPKNPLSSTVSTTNTNIEGIAPNLLVDENTPLFVVGFRFEERTEIGKNGNIIYFARTAPLQTAWDKDWGSGDMIVKIVSNENGKISGTFSGKNVDGKLIKNGSFSLKYKL
jgi:hypothetical protein